MTTASATRGAGKGAKVTAWMWIVGALAAAAVILAAWFPFTALGHQRSELAASSAQLSKLKGETKALQREQARLQDPKELARIAREQYQLVNPGDRVVQVLPPTASRSALATGKEPFAGDPGLRPPVSPSAAGLLGDRAGAPLEAVAKPAPPSKAQAEGFLQRVVRTLQFWR